MARDHDRANRLTLAVEFGQAATNVRADAHATDIAHPHGRAERADPDAHLLEFRRLSQIATPANGVFAPGHLQDAPPYLCARATHGVGHLRESEPVGA